MGEQGSLEERLRELELQLRRKDREIALLREANRNLAARLKLLQSVADMLSSSAQIERILDSIMEMVQRALKVEASSLILIDEERRELVFKVAKGPKGELVKRFRLKMGEGIAGWVAQHDQPLVVNDVQLDPRWKREIAELIEFETRSILCVPLRARGKVIGVIEAINKLDKGEFTQEDVEIISTLAAQAALTIENARLLQEAGSRIDGLSAVHTVASTIALSGDLEKVLSQIMDVAIAVTSAETGSLYLLDEERGELVPKVARGVDEEVLRQRRLKIGESITGWVAKHGVIQNIPDVHSDPRFKDPLGRGERLKSQISVPLKIGDRVIGVLNVFNKRGGAPFTPEDERLLSTFASQAAVAIENARLHQLSQERIQALTTLIEVGKLLSSKLEVDSLLREITEQARRVARAEAASLMLLDEKRGELEFRIALGPAGEQVKRFKVKVGEGIAGWVAKTGEPVIVNNVKEDPRFREDIARAIDFPTRSILAVPLKVEERVVGVLEAINRVEEGGFTSRDADVLMALGGQAAVAIQNARLYENLRRLFFATIDALVEAIDARDPYTHGHSRRVTDFALAIAEELGLTDGEREALQIAALLHDVGKIGINDEVLRKPGRLSPEERKEVEKHPVVGARIISTIELLKEIVPVVLHHHERFDGRGYPERKRMDEIPLLARIIAVADAFDAMTSDRPYRDALPDEKAVEEIKRQAGRQFDPKIVEAFVSAWEKGRIRGAKSLKGSEEGGG